MAQPNIYTPELFSFNQDPIVIKKPPPRKGLTICPQESAAVIVRPMGRGDDGLEERRKESIEGVGESKRTEQRGAGSSKIKKGMLRECISSVQTCLTQLLQSLSLVFLQLLELHSSSSQQIALGLLHQRTIRQATETIEKLQLKCGELNNDLSTLNSVSKEVCEHLSVFRKEYPLKRLNWKMPPHWKLFKLTE